VGEKYYRIGAAVAGGGLLVWGLGAGPAAAADPNDGAPAIYLDGPSPATTVTVAANDRANAAAPASEPVYAAVQVGGGSPIVPALLVLGAIAIIVPMRTRTATRATPRPRRPRRRRWGLVAGWRGLNAMRRSGPNRQRG
jgi:hypothetical protein